MQYIWHEMGLMQFFYDTYNLNRMKMKLCDSSTFFPHLRSSCVWRSGKSWGMNLFREKKKTQDIFSKIEFICKRLEVQI